jgi:hypothetical protein
METTKEGFWGGGLMDGSMETIVTQNRYKCNKYFLMSYPSITYIVLQLKVGHLCVHVFHVVNKSHLDTHFYTPFVYFPKFCALIELSLSL